MRSWRTGIQLQEIKGNIIRNLLIAGGVGIRPSSHFKKPEALVISVCSDRAMASDGRVVVDVTVPGGGTVVQPRKLLGPDEADLVSDGVDQLKVPVPGGRDAAHEASASVHTGPDVLKRCWRHEGWIQVSCWRYHRWQVHGNCRPLGPTGAWFVLSLGKRDGICSMA